MMGSISIRQRALHLACLASFEGYMGHRFSSEARHIVRRMKGMHIGIGVRKFDKILMTPRVQGVGHIVRHALCVQGGSTFHLKCLSSHAKHQLSPH
jgi:hypothetical protein